MRAISGQTHWKRSTGMICEHGLPIYVVNGAFIRNNWDSDFIQGANGMRYRFCPKGELWVDECVPKAEWPYVILHECVETELMRDGMSYDRAHTIAKRRENAARRRDRPAERRKW